MYRRIKLGIVSLATLFVLISLNLIHVFALDYKGLNFSDATQSGEDVLISVKATGGLWWDSTENKTVTITNNSGGKATISFDYSVDQSGYTIGGNGVSNGNNYTITLEAGGSFTIDVQTTAGAMSTSTITFTVSNITVTPVVEDSTITVLYDTSKGTVKNGTTTIANQGTVTVTEASPVTLSATVSNGQFVAWIDPADNKVLAKSENYTITSTGDKMIKALFVDATPWFFVSVNGSTYAVEGFDAAMGYSGTVVLANKATLSAGNYTIPAGMTLLIPFDDSATTDDVYNETAAYKMSEFRRLTLSSGTNITVNGTILLNAAQGHYRNNFMGQPVGAYGCLEMKSGSTITVNGTLKVRGLIIGDESMADLTTGAAPITVNSGATVIQLLQVCDFRGGSQAFSWRNAAAFLVNQLYIQNIQVATQYKNGSNLKGQYYIYAGKGVPGTMSMIGTDENCMFKLTSGSIYMGYDKANSVSVIDVLGTTDMNHIEVEFTYGITITLDTADSQLPLFGGWKINVKRGGTVNINYAAKVLPGCVITIDEGAVLNLNSSLYLYDTEDYDQSSTGYSFRDYRYYASTTSATGRYEVMPDTTTDGTLIINGTMNIGSNGKLYTSLSAGADDTYPLYSTTNTGTIVVAGTSEDTTLIELKQSDSSKPKVNFTAAQSHMAPNNVIGSLANTAATYYHYVGHGWSTVQHIIDENTGKCACGVSYAARSYGSTSMADAYYESVDAALEATAEDSAITVRIYTNHSITSAIFDLHGRVIEIATGAPAGTAITLASGSSIIDSRTDDFTSNDVGSIPGSYSGISKSSTGKNYVAIYNSTTNTTQFHRAGVSLTGIQYTLGTDYVLFQGTFKGSSDVAKALKRVGFRFSDISEQWYSINNAEVETTHAFTYARPKFEDPISANALLDFGVEPYAESMVRENITLPPS